MAISDVIHAVGRPIVSHALDEMLADYANQDFQVRVWDGTTWGSQDNPRFVLVLNSPEGLRRMLSSPTEVSLGEAFVAGEIDVEGDLEAAFELGDYLLSRQSSAGISQTLLSLLGRVSSHQEPASETPNLQLNGSAHSKQRDRQAVRYHYDLPPEFFALWLDPHMMYSSAYFEDATNDLDAAQEHKLDYICRKLRLHRGDHLLDIGCGWGGFIVYAASHYGVHAHGITLSVRQAETARQRIHNAGLDDRCRVDVCDYRDIESGQRFDKVVSIGMFEHVGKALLPEYFRRVWEFLRPGGAFLNSGIASEVGRHNNGPAFVDRFVFPDGELVPLNISVAAAEASGFEVRDIESLREHYAMTLNQWVQRLESSADKARNITDEATYRIWRLYMAGSRHQFRTGALNVYHILHVKPFHGDSGMPLTRADWYAK
jgi:cyclopropane-fatty-acyl-phospholipid synthase